MGDTGQITVEEVLEKVKKNYSKQEEKDAITGTSDNEDGKFPGKIEYDKPASGLKEKIVVTVDENLNVTSDVDSSNSIPGSSYTKVGKTYCNSPDVSKFNKQATYYITYDDNGNESIYGRIDKVEPPDDWYDYGEKRWANIVTVTDNDVAYWVWIPRYKYQVNSETQTIDAKFVTLSDTYIGEDEQEVSLPEYNLPESFTFAGKDLPGYWISKYEVQNSDNDTEFVRIVNVDGKDMLTVTDKSGDTNTSGTYTIYVNGEVSEKNATLPMELSKLKLGNKRDIMVVKNEGSKIIGAIRSSNGESAIEVDTSGFSPEATYYITYDDAGNESIYGRMDKVEKPEDWYNYGAKKWANLVTVTGNDVTYWTYIPRYEYKVFSGIQFVDVQFISKEKTTPDDGYQIPDSFKFGEEGKEVELAGYWISKYEVQDSNSNTEKIKIESGTLTTTATDVTSNTYTVYVNGEAKTGIALPQSLSEIGVNASNADICVINETTGKIVGARRGTIE